MNPQSSDELISAYFDGEVSPEERAAVERLLSENDDAQRELNETARLSALLHSFPRESAPADLAGKILQQTSQLEIPRVAQVHASRNVWRELRAALISAISTAAVLIVIWNVFDVPNEGRPVAQMNHTAAPSPVVVSPSVLPPRMADSLPEQQHFEIAKFDPMDSPVDQAKVGDAGMPASKGGPAPGPAVATQADVSIAGSFPAQKPGIARKMAAHPASAAPVPSPASAQLPATAPREAAAMAATDASIADIEELDTDVKFSNDRFLEGLQAGKVLRYVPQPADPANNVAVVDLQVVDVDRGLTEIQVMLQKHSIRKIADDTNRDGKSRQQAKDSKESESDELVFIYAFAPGERLALALQDVTLHPDLFPKWTPSQPLQIAANLAPTPFADLEKSDEKKGPEKSGNGANADAVQSKAKMEREIAESQMAVQALALRNSYQANSTNSIMNSIQQSNGLKRSQNAFGGGVAKSAQSPDGQNLVPENRSLNIGNGVAMVRRGAPAGNSSEGYEIIRIPTAEMNTVTNEFFNRSTLNGNADRTQADKTLANNEPPVSRPAAGGAQDPKLRESEYANGSVKVLFVLHPMQSEADAAPAPANNRDK
ncbi:MAG: zf-HC2 domain-containing protein [Planctomycetaceae bacterium]